MVLHTDGTFIRLQYNLGLILLEEIKFVIRNML
jgi:hypothetical protein